MTFFILFISILINIILFQWKKCLYINIDCIFKQFQQITSVYQENNTHYDNNNKQLLDFISDYKGKNILQNQLDIANKKLLDIRSRNILLEELSIKVDSLYNDKLLEHIKLQNQISKLKEIILSYKNSDSDTESSEENYF